MKSLLRRHLVLLMLGATAAAFTVNVNTPAFAKDGGDDNSGSGSSGSGHSGSSGHDDNSGSGGSDDGGSGGGDSSSSNGSDDDNDSNDDSNSRSRSSDDDNDSNDDSNNRSASNDDRKNGGGGNVGNKANRPRVEISVDAGTRAGLLNGTLVAVDNLGRPLEVEVEDGGVLIAKPHGGDAKRKPGPIASFKVVPAGQAPVHR